jgi:hypothetical protein
VLGSLRKLFQERVAPQIAPPSPEAREHLVRRIAGLLHVPHPDFIDAKIRARAQSGLGKG